MSKVKSQMSKVWAKQGFTLVELLVVISIMVILTSVLVINIAGQRAARDVKIAQNQLVSYIRQAQAYSLSSRTFASNLPGQYYILKFDLSKPNMYTLQVIYNASTNPQLADIQTVLLPPNVLISATSASTYPITISRLLNPTTQNISATGCALVAFAAPFGKIIFNNSCNPSSPPASPYTLQLSDDYYQNIVNFQTNITCDNNGNPPVCNASANSTMTITLTDINKINVKTVTINGITGAVTFN